MKNIELHFRDNASGNKTKCFEYNFEMEKTLFFFKNVLKIFKKQKAKTLAFHGLEMLANLKS